MKRIVYLIIMILPLGSCQEEDFGWESKDIRYRSEFFKEYGHPSPQSSFGFIDQPIYKNSPETRSEDANANMWGGYLEVPDPLSELQIEVITNWFRTHQNPQGISVNWTDYFAQQVSSKDIAKQHMDYILDAGHNGTDHINNFNSGDCGVNNTVWSGELRNPSDQNSKVYHSDKIMYMKNQSTKDFAYHETISSRTWKDHYVIIPGETIDPENQYGLHGMFFVGFDYESNKGNEINKIPRDWYFDDWIIKISPGLHKGYPHVTRIMCEDLGGSFDWDWNDVVFDVSFESYWDQYNRYDAIITLRCSGGTLPIKVGSLDSPETHEAFGSQTLDPILNPKTPVIYRLDVTEMPGIIQYGSELANAKNIPIYVVSQKATWTIQNSEVPQKFACPDTVKWSPEMKNIKEFYPKFPGWIIDDSMKDIWILGPQ